MPQRERERERERERGRRNMCGRKERIWIVLVVRPRLCFTHPEQNEKKINCAGNWIGQRGSEGGREAERASDKCDATNLAPMPNKLSPDART